mgnify:CR=1 FL=1
MKIVQKYYDKNLKLITIKDKSKNYNSIIRFKVINDNEFPCCDFKGKCTNKAHAEVYQMAMKNSKKKGWSYLCKKHYLQEEKRLKWKLPASLSVEW